MCHAASTNGGTTSDHLTGFNTAADNWNMALAVDTTPATNTFVVPRSAAPTDGTKLKMTIDLSQANCRDTGTQTCGDGKYVVKQVTAWPWFPTTAYTGGIDGSKTAGSAREAYTFVGKWRCGGRACPLLLLRQQMRACLTIKQCAMCVTPKSNGPPLLQVILSLPPGCRLQAHSPPPPTLSSLLTAQTWTLPP